MNERRKWAIGGVLILAGVALGSLATLCYPDHREKGEREHEPVHARPVVEPAVVSADAGSDAHDAAAPLPLAPPSALPKPVDAGPSCGSHPWCVVPLECCEPDGSCCAS